MSVTLTGCHGKENKVVTYSASNLFKSASYKWLLKSSQNLSQAHVSMAGVKPSRAGRAGQRRTNFLFLHGRRFSKYVPNPLDIDDLDHFPANHGGRVFRQWPPSMDVCKVAIELELGGGARVLTL